MAKNITPSSPPAGRNGGGPRSPVPDPQTSTPSSGPPIGQLAHALDAGLFLLEGDGSISFATPRAQTFLGLQVPEGGGSGSVRLNQGNQIAREIAARIPSGNAAGAGVHKEILQLGTEGERFLSIAFSPFRSGNGSSAWAVMVEDVTAIVGKGKEASQWARELVHDLKSPLSTVAGSIDLIFSGRLGDLDPKLKKFLDLAQKGIDRLIDMLTAAGKSRPAGTPEVRVVEGVPSSIGEEGFNGKKNTDRG